VGGPRVLPPVLDANRWVLEAYGTLIGSLRGIAWILLIYFLVALIACVVARTLTSRKSR